MKTNERLLEAVKDFKSKFWEEPSDKEIESMMGKRAIVSSYYPPGHPKENNADKNFVKQ